MSGPAPPGTRPAGLSPTERFHDRRRVQDSPACGRSLGRSWSVSRHRKAGRWSSALEATAFDLGAQGGHVAIGLQRRRTGQLVVAHAVRAAMRPVDRDTGSHEAAEQLADGNAERLALDVEQGVLDGTLVDAVGRLRCLTYRPEPMARMGWGSVPINASAMPWMTEVRPRLPSASVYSGQPIRPSSVVITRKEKVRQPASACMSSMRSIFTVGSSNRS